MSRNSPKNNPLRVALTGGIGSGKSLAGAVFQVLGVPVYNADIEAKEILEKDAAVRESVIEAFGAEAFIGDKPDRTFLAEAVFGNDKARAQLNSIIHPAVLSSFEKWVEEHRDFVYVVKEAAITIEMGLHTKADALVLVTAPKELRLKRVVKRDGSKPEDIENRMKAQWTDEEKLGYATFVVKNDDCEPVIPQILQIHNALLRSV